MNLLAETLHELRENDKAFADVRWVQCRPNSFRRDEPSLSFSWDEFLVFADFDYDNGYGGAEVNQSLKIVGDDWWLERGEYDGSEWWEFKTMPKKPEEGKPRQSDLMENP